MPELNCSVLHCGNNEDGFCCLNDISISGKNAHKSSDTFCADFIDENLQIFKDIPLSKTDIECAAESCMFNLNGSCGASKVKVGKEKSYRCRDTECDSFLDSKESFPERD
ncbi:MAG: DUF1540 domain-containing protein [Oscillospiraceae bacterium]|nr:DUF1540 domain-containing protein [Oscillospiraceae bacterium]